MLTRIDMLNAISNLPINDLQFLNRSICDTIKHKQKLLKNTFSVGDKVEWTNTRTGAITTGTVVKLAQIAVHVQTDRGITWRVTPSLLRQNTYKAA